MLTPAQAQVIVRKYEKEGTRLGDDPAPIYEIDLALIAGNILNKTWVSLEFCLFTSFSSYDGREDMKVQADDLSSFSSFFPKLRTTRIERYDLAHLLSPGLRTFADVFVRSFADPSL